jgi:exosortase H (IPTLxxWG-CTERM-specific)
MRLRFLVFFLLLGFGSALGSSEVVQKQLLAPLCVGEAFVSEKLMRLLGGNVIRIGAELHDTITQKAIVVLWACSGADATFIVLSAILVYPSCWRAKIKGLVAGLLVIQGMNVLRIISLFYLNQWRSDAFEFAHLYLWQGLLILDSLIFMLFWLRWEKTQCRIR